MSLEIRVKQDYIVTVGERFDCSCSEQVHRLTPELGGVVMTSEVDDHTTVDIATAHKLLQEPYVGMGGSVGPGPKEILIWPLETWQEVKADYRMPGSGQDVA